MADVPLWAIPPAIGPGRVTKIEPPIPLQLNYEAMQCTLCARFRSHVMRPTWTENYTESSATATSTAATTSKNATANTLERLGL